MSILYAPPNVYGNMANDSLRAVDSMGIKNLGWTELDCAIFFFSEKTRSSSCMAGCWSNLVYKQKNGIIVTIEPDGADFLGVTRTFSLMPELVSASAPIVGLTCGTGFLPCFFIHIGQHKDFAACCVLCNGRNKAFGKIRIKIVLKIIFYFWSAHSFSRSVRIRYKYKNAYLATRPIPRILIKWRLRVNIFIVQSLSS